MKNGFSGSMFDFDRDGELNSMERAMDFMAFKKLTEERDVLCEDDDELDDATDEFDW